MTPPRPRPSAAPGSPLTSTLILCLVALLAGCAPPGRTAGSSAAYLYVANSADGTIAPLESQSGRPAAPPVAVGAAATQIVAGPSGSLLVLSTSSTSPGGAHSLTHAVRSGSGWRTRPVDLGASAQAAMLAGDGGRYAVVAFHLDNLSGGGPPPSRPPRRLALVDVVAGAVERTLTVCGPRERVGGVALETGPAGLVAYLGIWHAAGEEDARGPSGGRVVALDAVSGAVLAVAPLAGLPGYIAYVPGRSHLDGRLYCVEHASFFAYDTSIGTRSRLLALNPATLQIERELPLRHSPLHFGVAPDGNHAYGLTSGGTSLVQLDLATGAETPVAALAGQGFGLAVTDSWVYVSHPKGNEVWMVDRRRGAVGKAIPVGQQPTALALGSGAVR